MTTPTKPGGGHMTGVDPCRTCGEAHCVLHKTTTHAEDAEATTKESDRG